MTIHNEIYPKINEEKLKKFNYTFNQPCIVNATLTKESFINILKSKTLLRPKLIEENKLIKTTTFIDEIANLDNCIWFTSGFKYNTWVRPYAFIFKISEIDSHFEIFGLDFMMHLYKVMIRYFIKNMHSEIELLIKYPRMKIAIEHFIKTDKNERFISNYKDIPWGWFFPWDLNEEFSNWWNNKTQEEKKILQESLSRLFRREKIKLKIPFYHKKQFIKEAYFKSIPNACEIVSHKEIYLDNKNLIGFFIFEAFSNDYYFQNDVKTTIKTFINNSKKIDKKNIVIFDGKQIKKIKECLHIWT
jgi:hypothetical protein